MEPKGVFIGPMSEFNFTTAAKLGLEGGSDELPFTILYYWTLMLIGVGLVGNSLLIYVGHRFLDLTIPPYAYILNLALAQIVILTKYLLDVITSRLGDSALGSVGCKIFWALPKLGSSATTLFVLVLSIDRFIAVTKGSTPTTRRFLAIGSVWLISLAQCVPVLLLADTAKVHNNSSDPHNRAMEVKETCKLDSIYQAEYDGLYVLLLNIALILYFKSLCCAKCRNPFRSAENENSDGDGPQVTKFVLKLLALFLMANITWKTSKMLATLLSLALKIDHFAYGWLFLIGDLFFGMDIILRPILIFHQGQDFKRGFKKVFGCSLGNEEDHFEVSYNPWKTNA